jgi:hypothetical protein
MAQTVCILLGDEDRLAVARQTALSRPALWRWRQRFAGQGVDGLLRDKTRKPGKKPLPAATVAKIPALPCKPPRQATHRTGRMVAKAVGVSLCAVQRIWQANRRSPTGRLAVLPEGPAAQQIEHASNPTLNRGRRPHSLSQKQCRPGEFQHGAGHPMEAFLFLVDSIVVLILVYMGLRDDRRPPGTPQASLFRTFDYDAVRPGGGDARQDRTARIRVR